MNAPASFPNDTAFRAAHVGASEVAALFDESPWLTRFELYHRKAGTIATPAFNAIGDDGKPDNERVYWGVMLEPLIVQGACERWGYQPIDTPHLLTNGKGLGGHPDRIVEDERGRGILECKMVDWLVVKGWGDEPPLHYLLQAQTYAGLAGVAWCDLIVLVGGNELRRFQYDFRPGLFAEVERRVAEFWQSVRAGEAPTPDFNRDGATIREVLGEPDGTLIDLRTDNSADDLAAEYLLGRKAEKIGAMRAEAARNELLMKIGTAGTALLGAHRIGCGQTKGSPGTLITADHVGTTIGARKGYRRFDVRKNA